MSSIRRNVLIVVLFCVVLAAPTARSQDVAAPASVATLEDLPLDAVAAQPLSGGARAALLAGGRGWRTSDPDDGALASLVRRLGDLRLVGPALLAGYVTGRVGDVPDLSASSARVAGATVGAALLCGALRSAAGRPAWLEGNGATAFPSSRATVAFAVAAAVDGESRPGWVRWVVYPLAAGAAALDAHECGLGAGTALAGAALGLSAGHAFDRIERERVSLFERARFVARGSRREFRVGFQASF